VYDKLLKPRQSFLINLYMKATQYYDVVLYCLVRFSYSSCNVAVCFILSFKVPIVRVVLQEFLELKGLSLGLQAETEDKILTSLFTNGNIS